MCGLIILPQNKEDLAYLYYSCQETNSFSEMINQVGLHTNMGQFQKNEQ